MKVTGVVLKGKQEGAGLGFPTANVKIPESLEILPGIYAGHVLFEGKQYSSAIYITGNGILEAFLMDFSGDLYGQEIEVQIGKKIREPIVFTDKAHAVSQITEDIKQCLQELSKK